jgi:hypothetical protein
MGDYWFYEGFNIKDSVKLIKDLTFRDGAWSDKNAKYKTYPAGTIGIIVNEDSSRVGSSPSVYNVLVNDDELRDVPEYYLESAKAH